MNSPWQTAGGHRDGSLQSVAQSALETPVLLLIFNRPETTRAVMDTLRLARPTQLYVAADGPRSDRPADPGLCEAARQEATAVDWPCEVRTLYRDRNLGCGVGVSSGITWFFENTEQGIILEDDCVPSPSFYRFCSALLEHHRADPRIMHIAGANFQYGRTRGAASYYYSRYVNVWGWAAWRRAWNHYDFSLRPAWQLKDTWDTQWQLSVERAGGLAVVPNANLVKHIGYGPDATHTTEGERAANLEALDISFPLKHPSSDRPSRTADLFTYYVHHRQVQFPSLIALYRTADWVIPRLKGIKRWLIGVTGQISQLQARSPGLSGGWGGLGRPKESVKDRLLGSRIQPLRALVRAVLLWRRQQTEQRRYKLWIASGRPLPPPQLYKQMMVRDAAREHGAEVLVETGTFRGEMVEAVAGDYQRIFTIELDASLSARAVKRFEDSPHVTVLQGDSTAVLPGILKNLDEPAVFWLDAHCSGAGTSGDPHQSPIRIELEQIAKHAHHQDHVILIDDAREFTGGAYPGLREVESWARSVGYDQIQVENDIIKISGSPRTKT